MKFSGFKKRPAYTLLFITEVKTFRIDADRKGVLISELETIEQGCEDPTRLAKTILKISEQSPPFGAKTWLLFLRLPAHLLSLPTMQVQGVDDEMLLQALEFELEGITGQSSMDSRTAFQLLRNEDDMSEYWLTQIDQLSLDDTVKALKKCKSKLAGLLYPGGLPMPLNAPEDFDWLRLEAWPNQLYALSQKEDDLTMQAFSFDNHHWQNELEQWLMDFPDSTLSEALFNNKLEVLPETRNQYHLNRDHDLILWLGLWSQCLITDKNPSVPIIKPAGSYNPDMMWMAGTGVGALALCLLHAGWFISQSNHYQFEVDRLTKIDQSMKGIRKQITDSRGQKDSLQKKLDKLQNDAERIPETIVNLQQRPAKLLKALALGRDPNLIIETIENSKNNLVINGVTLEPLLANQLAVYLQNNLPNLNWHVQAPVKKDMKLFDGGGPWSFEITLIDEGIPGFSLKEKQS